MVKTWAEMRTEVSEVNHALGWWDKPVSFKTAMCLLHSEVDEALEAWRRWGFEDQTDKLDENYARDVPKPEGFASELGDVLIRLLDDDERFGLDLGVFWDDHMNQGVFAVWQDVGDNLDDLHNDISRASMAWERNEGLAGPHQTGYGRSLANLLTRLQILAGLYGVNLEAEYRRKLAYNRTRPYRHGKAV